MSVRALCGLVILCMAAGTVSGGPSAIKKRIAVFEFEDKTDGSIGWWRGGQTVGQGMADMLVTSLVKSGRYIVIEREKIARVMQEQSLGASGAVNEESATSLGELLGVELAVFGAVTEFSVKEEKRGGRAPVFGPRGPRSIGLSISKAEARVTVDVRLVNTATGQILAAESVSGIEDKKGVSVSGRHARFRNEAEFDESMIGKASRKALDAIVVKVGEQMGSVRWSGRIVKSDGASVIINAGSAIGVSVGDTLVVYSRGEDLIDPETGMSLGSEETEVGSIIVTGDMASGKASKCQVIKGSGGQRGDVVRYAL